MLNPFLIRDLHASPSQALEDGAPSPIGRPSGELPACDNTTSDRTGLHGIVRLTGPEYDDIASNHPRARLTYIDDDDGELITVGSSLELSQRLNEPVDSPSKPDIMQQPTASSKTEPSEMHLFDIRRSNSVTELWKKFEYPSYAKSAQNSEVQDKKVEDASPNHEVAEASNSASANATSVVNDGAQPLLAAFEAEMAKLLGASEGANAQPPQPDRSSSAGAESEPPSSGNLPNPAETLILVISNIVNGAEMVRDEVRSRVQELERRLQDAQRALPEHVGTTLQVALTTLDSSVRNLAGALNNVAVSGAQRSSPNAQAQPSAATHAIDGLRTVAAEIGQMGQTLFAAFEHELGSRQRDTAQAPDEDIRTPKVGNQDEGVTADVPAPDGGVAATEATGRSSKNEEVALGLHDARNTESNTQSDERAGERNATSSGYENWSSMQPVQHHVPPPPPPPFMRPSDNNAKGNTSDTCRTEESARHSFPQAYRPRYLPPGPPPFQAPPIPLAPFSPPQPPYPTPFWYAGRPPWPVQPLSFRRRPEFHQDLPQSGAHRLASNTLFIGNVGFNVSASMIQTVFASKGFLVDVDLPVDSQARTHAGFGYLKFASTHAAKAALEALQGTHIDGHSINLEFSDNSPVTGIHTSREFQAKQNKLKDRSNVKARSSFNSQNDPEPSNRQRGTFLKEQNNKGKERASCSDRRASLSQGANEARVSISDDIGSSHSAASGIRPLLDQDNGDQAFSARYPSLLPETSAGRSRFSSFTDPLARLSPELEMRRFPPVSQLEAHAIAAQRGEVRSSATASPHEAEKDDDKNSEAKNASPPVPGSFPQDPQDFPEMEEQPKQGLRRSNTVMPVNPSARLTGPFNPNFSADSSHVRPLRRRATERHSLHHKIFEDRQHGPYWRRPAIRTEESVHPPRHSFRPHHKPLADPISVAHEHAAQTSTPSDIDRSDDRVRIGSQDVDDCVAALLRLGYGGARDGGHARIRMYSEVANGKVLEAVEMIEEERKAYEQQMRQ